MSQRIYVKIRTPRRELVKGSEVCVRFTSLSGLPRKPPTYGLRKDYLQKFIPQNLSRPLCQNGGTWLIAALVLLLFCYT